MAKAFRPVVLAHVGTREYHMRKTERCDTLQGEGPGQEHVNGDGLLPRSACSCGGHVTTTWRATHMQGDGPEQEVVSGDGLLPRYACSCGVT